MQLSVFFATSVLVLVVARGAGAIDIVIDYALDASNENWFDPLSAEGQARRDAVSTAAEFLSTIITNDDWESLPTLNETFSVSDIAASSIFDLDGNLLEGTAESDGDGYTYSRRQLRSCNPCTHTTTPARLAHRQSTGAMSLGLFGH